MDLSKTLCRLSIAIFLLSIFAGAADLTKSNYQNWSTYRLSNGVVSVQIAPQLAGRLIQYSLGTHNFLWANPVLAGQNPPASGLGPGDSWLNWGGDKLWPAPQGWDGPTQWPGPPDGVLDGSPQHAELLDGPGLRLTSPKDSRTGIQFQRVVTLEDDSSVLHVHASMTDIDSKPRSWGIWSVTELDASDHNGKGFNPEFWTYIPVNPKSRYSAGYKVVYGSATNSEFAYDAPGRMVRAHYQRQVGKIGMDSSAGWVASVDGETGYVFVQTFPHYDRDYPDDSSVEYWSYGLGKILAFGKEVTQPESVSENPYVAETELISPFAHLQPGETYFFDYDWRSANLGGNYPIVECSSYGCISEQFSAMRSNGSSLHFAGRFGVFYVGEISLVFLDGAGRAIGKEVRKAVDPNSAFLPGPSFNEVAAPQAATMAVLYLSNHAGKRLVELARAPIGRKH